MTNVGSLIQFTSKSKDNFFDRAAVMQLVDETESKAFNKIGGRIRTWAMRSQRKGGKKKKPSAAGEPPKRHTATGSGLTKIYYTYERSQHRVLIGPVKFNWSAYPDATVPQVHEFGKRVQIVELDYSFKESGKAWSMSMEPKWIRVGPRGIRKRGNRPMRTRMATYPARPFMFPALEANRRFITDTWGDARVSVGS